MSTNNPTRPMWMVIPCGGTKLDRPAPARDLYCGHYFRMALAAAEAEVAAAEGPATTLVLSALHGLITLDTVLEPYNLRMGDPGSVRPEVVADQASQLGIVWEANPEVYALLPLAYFKVLDEALRRLSVFPFWVFEGAGRMGNQLAVCARIRDGAPTVHHLA